MTDFRRFLNPTSETLEVLAYTGGRFVLTRGRRFRLVTVPDTPGWYSFRIRGRNAELVAREETPLLDGLPLLRGHAWGSHVVLPDASAPALAFLPSDEPLGFAPLVVRRWHDGALVVEGEDFETEHEEQVRGALELGEGLRGLRHVPASLRAAFVYAVCEAEAGAASWQPLELRARLPLLAEGGSRRGPSRAPATRRRTRPCG